MGDYAESIQDGLKESKKFFSNPNKPETELWVLREFLSYLPIEVVESDIAPSTQESHDVFYGPYGFQVKEVLSALKGSEPFCQFRPYFLSCSGFLAQF